MTFQSGRSFEYEYDGRPFKILSLDFMYYFITVDLIIEIMISCNLGYKRTKMGGQTKSFELTSD